MTLSSKTEKIKYTYICFITWRYDLVHVSIGMVFQTGFYGESNVIYSKFHNAYYGDPILP